jgi:hypothetical protein
MIRRDILMRTPRDQSQRRERSYDAACHGIAMIPDLGAVLARYSKATAYLGCDRTLAFFSENLGAPPKVG